MTIPPATGNEPPDRLVPLPRATNGESSTWQNRTSAITSSALSGSHDGQRVRAECRQPIAFVRGQLLRLATKALAGGQQRRQTIEHGRGHGRN